MRLVGVGVIVVKGMVNDEGKGMGAPQGGGVPKNSTGVFSLPRKIPASLSLCWVSCGTADPWAWICRQPVLKKLNVSYCVCRNIDEPLFLQKSISTYAGHRQFKHPFPPRAVV